MSTTKIKPPPGMAECPECDPCNPDLDEDGRPYACYACGDTGWMPAEAVAEHVRQQAWSSYAKAEASIRERARLGVPAGWGYYFDDVDGELQLVPPRGQSVALPLYCVDSDIPF